MPSVVAAVVAAVVTAAAATTTWGAVVIIGELTVAGVLGAVAGMATVSVLSQRSMPSAPSSRGAGTTPTFSSKVQGRSIIVRSSVETHRIIYGRTRVSGPLAHFNTSNSAQAKKSDGEMSTPDKPNLFYHMIIILAAHEIEEIQQVQLGETFLTLDEDGYATNDEYKGEAADGINYHLVRVFKHLGATDQAADSKLVEELDEWTEDHKLQGRAYIYVRLMYSSDKFPSGIPQVRAIVKGKKLYDPRDQTTSWSDNWALCVRDYITNNSYGFGAESDERDDDTFIAAANASDENVPLKDESNYNRYTCNGVLNTKDKSIDNLRELISAGAGAVTYMQGKFRCHAGVYNSPSVEIDESWLRGPIIVKARPPRAELFNAIRGIYQDESKYWQPSDFPPVKNSLYKEQDNNEEIFEDIELPFVNHEEPAQRIAKIILEKGRQGIVADLYCNYSILQVGIWDTIKLTNKAFGWDKKIFRVLNWKLISQGGINVTVQEESSESYDWNAGEATTYDPAPDTTLPSAFEVAQPGTPVVVEELFVTSDGASVRTKAVLTWEKSPDAFVFRYVVQYKLSASSIWITSVETNDATHSIFDLGAGIFDFRVKALNTYLVSSTWSQSQKELFGLTAPPADLTNFSLTVLHNNAYLQWDQSQDIDVRVAGKIRLRHSPRTLGATWSEARDLGDALPGIATNATVPLLEGTYIVKAVDSTGHESVNNAAISTNVVNIIRMNYIDDSIHHPTFSGTKTNMIVIDGDKLTLDWAETFDTITGLFDDQPGFFDNAGGTGYKQAGSYSFDDVIDFGAVFPIRITSEVRNVVYSGISDFDAAPGLFDDREGLFDGEDVSTMQVITWIRTTNSDPASFNLFDSVPGLFDSIPGNFDSGGDYTTSDWSTWRPFLIGDYNARAFDFKLTIASQFSSHNVEIDRLSVTLDVADREESEEDYSLSAAGETFTFNKPFFIVPNIGISAQDLDTGDYFRITNKSKTSFDLRVYNSVGTGVARLIDWIAKAY